MHDFLEGVTTAIVVFLLICIALPSLIKHRHQYYAALAVVLVIILFQSLATIINREAFSRFTGALTGLLQIAAILLLVLAAGGLGVRQLAGDLARAYEVIRRGEEEKEVIIPLSNQPPRQRHEYDEDDLGDYVPRRRYEINEPEEPSGPPTEEAEGAEPAAPPPAEAAPEGEAAPQPPAREQEPQEDDRNRKGSIPLE